jgi:hypothetical protein
VDISVGQFQDYAIYRTHVGLQPTDLTYDRGVMTVADLRCSTSGLAAEEARWTLGLTTAF